MSVDFILIIILGAWAGVNEWRIRKLEIDIKNLKDRK